jgi:myo-inositol 2-dehydrogenase/D-chiro-inositol 1-dehydrogenase
MRIGLVGAGRIGAFHARTLSRLPGIDRVVLTDADPDRARTVAARVGAEVADTAADVMASGVRGVVIAAPTSAHAELVCAAAAAGLPVFCEKPISPELPGTRKVLDEVQRAGVALQVGFQRRFDPGYRAVRSAVVEGRLGWLHTVRAYTADPVPPPAGYLATSGGIFRDCSVHDFDVVRWITGREVVEVYATGANRGGCFFAEAGDVDTGVAVLTLDDGTLVTCGATRYNGAGCDVRLEVCGSVGTLVAGLDDRAPLVSAEVVGWPADSPYRDFMDRFHDAYVAELAAFRDVAEGLADSPCTGADALEALLVAEAAELSRRAGRPVRIAEVRA